MSEPLDVKVYANGDWHPMPMTTADAARLIRERDEARAEVERILGLLEDVNDEAGRLRELNRDTRDRLADWHEDNYEVMTLVDGATNNEGRPSLAIIAAVRAWLDSVPT